MRQGWVQIVGLIADISGFMLIVTEWWNAVIRERATELLHTAKRYEVIAQGLAASTPRGSLGKRLMNYLLLKLMEEKHWALSRAQKLTDHDPVLVFRHPSAALAKFLFPIMTLSLPFRLVFISSLTRRRSSELNL